MTRLPQERVADAFNAYFANFEIAISPEEATIGSRRTLGKRGWRITYRVDPDDGGFPNLEFYATNRMTDDRHVRIWADGHVEHLEAIHEFYAYDTDEPHSRQDAKDAYLKHNRAVAAELRARGLYPEGDINAFLRTGGGDSEE